MVRFDADGLKGRVRPTLEADGGLHPPAGALHVLTAVQPFVDHEGDENTARMAVLDSELRTSGLRFEWAVGSSFDGAHSEESRAVFGLTDAEACRLGLRFGQVAVFAWNGPRWSLLECAGAHRQTHRGWRWDATL